jgi:hypothetical protein
MYQTTRRYVSADGTLRELQVLCCVGQANASLTPAIPSQHSQYRHSTHNTVTTLTIPSQHSQYRHDTHNTVTALTMPSQHSQYRHNTHNAITTLTIPSQHSLSLSFRQFPRCPRLGFGNFLRYKTEIALLFGNRVRFFSSVLPSLMNTAYGGCEEGWNCLHLSFCLPSNLFTLLSIWKLSLQIMSTDRKQDTDRRFCR